MRIASVNLNKGMSGSRGAAFRKWLRSLDVAFLCLQEPVAASKPLPSSVEGFDLVHGNSNVAAYARGGITPSGHLITDRWLRCAHGLFTIDVVCLPHETRTSRTSMLEALANEPPTPRLVVGDFNLAPRPVDGRYGEAESKWTGPAERRAFQALLDGGLADLGALAVPEFTFQKLNRGEWTRFRCDLALLSEDLVPSSRLSVDHVVRNPTVGFTDHSALLLDLSS